MEFTIKYYDGEGAGYIDISGYSFKSIQEAIDFCHKKNIPLSIVNITEWDNTITDLYGVGEIVGQCNLEECFLEKYLSLDF